MLRSGIFLIREPIPQTILLFSANVVLFLRIGIQTMIPLLGLIGLYILFSIFYFAYPGKIDLKRKIIASVFIGPFLVNCLLTFNYFLSFNPTTETYVFTYNYETVRGMGKTSSRQRSSIINLSNDRYKDCPGIRIFWDFDKVAPASKITYTFKTGIFGIRVMRDYVFI